MNHFKLASMLALQITIAQVARADDLGAQLQLCAATSSKAHRLECYDRLSASLPGGPTSATTATSTGTAALAPANAAAAPPSAPSTTVQTAPSDPAAERAEFGISGGPLAAKIQASKIQSLTAGVAKVAVVAYGQLVVTLDNGQIWLQNQAVQYYPLKVGDQVEISTGALGSYVMVAPSKRVTKVTRIS